MADYRDDKNGTDAGDLISWIVTIILLVSPVWPVGLIMLFRKLTGASRGRRQPRHPYDIQRESGAPAPGHPGNAGYRQHTPGRRRPRGAEALITAPPARASR